VLSADNGVDDWNPKDTPDDLVRRLAHRLDGYEGGIFLLHDANGTTADALPALLRTFKDKGFRIVHLHWKQ
jgi:peptidoglycan/xylan/chitin deacetylase (PgdA/CDA1 family)